VARRRGRRRERALVTGGAGFVGSHLCERLLCEGYRVFCMDNPSSGSVEVVDSSVVGCSAGCIPFHLHETSSVDAGRRREPAYAPQAHSPPPGFRRYRPYQKTAPTLSCRSLASECPRRESFRLSATRPPHRPGATPQPLFRQAPPEVGPGLPQGPPARTRRSTECALGFPGRLDRQAWDSRNFVQPQGQGVWGSLLCAWTFPPLCVRLRSRTRSMAHQIIL
jgi:hypothetical protein